MRGYGADLFPVRYTESSYAKAISNFRSRKEMSCPRLITPGMKSHTSRSATLRDATNRLRARSIFQRYCSTYTTKVIGDLLDWNTGRVSRGKKENLLPWRHTGRSIQSRERLPPIVYRKDARSAKLRKEIPFSFGLFPCYRSAEKKSGHAFSNYAQVLHQAIEFPGEPLRPLLLCGENSRHNLSA